MGIDFGGVIVRNRNQSLGADTDLTGREKTEVAQDGVFEALREIVRMCEGRVWIVSKAGPRMEARTRAWLNEVDFFSHTGMNPGYIEFCRERQEKEAICRELQISHFIDDRIHVMQILRYTVPHLYLFGEQTSESFCPPWASFVSRWSRVVELLAFSLHEK